MSRCEDCGCILEQGICSNCQEELFIATFQQDVIDDELSNEFMDMAVEQSQYIERNR